MKIDLGNNAFMIICSALVFIMTPGVSLFYSGMVRRKNIINTLMSSFFICGLSSVMWVLVGYSLSFGDDFHGIIGKLNFFGLIGVGLEPSVYAPTIPQMLFAAFQMMFAVSAPALIVGSLVERIKFSALFAFVGVWLLFVYYPMAHMVWGSGGLINSLGAVDFAGGNVVHISSGVSGLVACIMLGNRHDYYRRSYRPSNIPLVILGASLIWFGWFGFNAGSALGADPICSTCINDNTHFSSMWYAFVDVN